MGGIAGWMALPRHAPEDEAMAAVLEAIAHRGPHGARGCAAPSRTHRVVFGHRRLHAADALQPLCDEPAGIAITADGPAPDAVLEAYRRWEADAASHLSGAFAFALWDAQKERLLLARDRFGEKPLYYCESNGSVFFASEVKALLAIPGVRPELDPRAVRDLLACGYVPAPRTLFRGIGKLAAATCAVWQHGRRREARYWTPPDRQALKESATSEVDAVARFVAELEDRVKERLAGGDAAVFLSGRLDSAVLVALIGRHQRTVKTFSVALENSPARGLARMAQHLGSDHHELTLTRHELLESLPELIAYLDAPVPDPVDVAMFRLARAAAPASSIVLSETGANEVLAGHRRHLVERLGWPLARGDWRVRCRRAAGGIDSALCDRLAGPLLNGARVLDGKAPFDAAADASRLRRALYFDQASVLPDSLVERAERTAIAAGVEARMPYADHRLAGLVSAFPDTLRVRRLTTKWILRRAARQILPKRLRRHDAAARGAPLAEWMRTDWRDMLIDHLHSRTSLTRGYFNTPVLDRVLEEHLKGRQDHQQLLWMLLSLEIWHRTYRPG